MTRKRRYPNVTSFTDRHGKLRWRWRKTGFPTHYFTNPPDTAGFKDELDACKAGAPLSPGAGRCIPRSVGDLVARYYGSTNYNRGGADSRRVRRGIIESFRAQFADDLVVNFHWQHIEAILAERAKKGVNASGRAVGGPVASLNLRKQLRRLFAYAKRLEWITENPVDEAERVPAPKTSGFYSWTEEDIAKFQAHHALGTRGRLALEIMLWTGQRRGDARLLGPDQVKNGQITIGRVRPGPTCGCRSLPSCWRRSTPCSALA